MLLQESNANIFRNMRITYMNHIFPQPHGNMVIPKLDCHRNPPGKKLANVIMKIVQQKVKK